MKLDEEGMVSPRYGGLYRLLVPFSTWKHLKTNSTYTVLGISRCSTNGADEGKEVVVYFSHTYQQLRHRDVDEFIDGRFAPVPASDPKEV